MPNRWLCFCFLTALLLALAGAMPRAMAQARQSTPKAPLSADELDDLFAPPVMCSGEQFDEVLPMPRVAQPAPSPMAPVLLRTSAVAPAMPLPQVMLKVTVVEVDGEALQCLSGMCGAKECQQSACSMPYVSVVSDKACQAIVALRNAQLAKTLAAPVLITLDGQSATCSIATMGKTNPSCCGGCVTQLSLHCTPHIRPDGHVALDCEPETTMTEACKATAGATCPSSITLRAHVAADVAAGQTMAVNLPMNHSRLVFLVTPQVLPSQHMADVKLPRVMGFVPANCAYPVPMTEAMAVKTMMPPTPTAIPPMACPLCAHGPATECQATPPTRVGEGTWQDVVKIVRAHGTAVNAVAAPRAQQVLLKTVVAEIDRAGVEELGLNVLPDGKQIVQQDCGKAEKVIQRLREANRARLLAAPSLVALDGGAASFLAGGEFPMPMPTNGEVMGVNFVPFGVQLQFTPHLVGADCIRLDMGVTLSTRTATAGAIPELDTRSVRFSQEMMIGQTAIIGGIPEAKPGCSGKCETVLVVLVTPEIVSAP